jgi:hypothetical protein
LGGFLISARRTSDDYVSTQCALSTNGWVLIRTRIAAFNSSKRISFFTSLALMNNFFNVGTGRATQKSNLARSTQIVIAPQIEFSHLREVDMGNFSHQTLPSVIPYKFKNPNLASTQLLSTQ